MYVLLCPTPPLNLSIWFWRFDCYRIQFWDLWARYIYDSTCTSDTVMLMAQPDQLSWQATSGRVPIQPFKLLLSWVLLFFSLFPVGWKTKQKNSCHGTGYILLIEAAPWSNFPRRSLHETVNWVVNSFLFKFRRSSGRSASKGESWWHTHRLHTQVILYHFSFKIFRDSRATVQNLLRKWEAGRGSWSVD